MESRKHPRFKTSTPMEYYLPVNGLNTTWALKGVMQDISLGGCYFTCKNRLWMDRGHTLDFKVDVSPLQPDAQEARYLNLQGVVVRLGCLPLGSDPWGVGVAFLQTVDIS